MLKNCIERQGMKSLQQSMKEQFYLNTIARIEKWGIRIQTSIPIHWITDDFIYIFYNIYTKS